MTGDVDSFTRALRRSAAIEAFIKRDDVKFVPPETPFLQMIRKQSAKKA